MFLQQSFLRNEGEYWLITQIILQNEVEQLKYFRDKTE